MLLAATGPAMFMKILRRSGVNALKSHPPQACRCIFLYRMQYEMSEIGWNQAAMTVAMGEPSKPRPPHPKAPKMST
jgi:hypothetical protein